jgi:hypothetical protein
VPKFFLQIISIFSNDDVSAERSRELKLASLELPGNEDFEYEHITMSVNETTLQNVLQYNFP